MKELSKKNLINPDLVTVTGRTVGENLAAQEQEPAGYKAN